MAERRGRCRRGRSRPAGASALEATRPAPRRAQHGGTQLTRTLAAVDLGAQSGRVAVGRFDGERLTVDEVHRFPNVPVSDDRLRWDLPRLRADVETGLRRAGPVDSVAIDSWAVDFGLLDESGVLLANPVHYRDARRAAAFDEVLEQIPARELYERTAIQLLPINTLCELAAEGADELARAARLLMIPDLFHHWLCGSESTERTNASTTQCFDPHTGDWARDLLDTLGVPTAILPEVVPPGTLLGETTDGATVVATATHDTASAVAATPLRGEGSVYLSVGTWSLVGVELDEPIVDDAAFRANLTNEGGVEGTYRLLRNLSGLWLLHECTRVWAEAGRKLDYEQLVALARDAPPLRSLVDPNDPRFLEPGDMPARIADFCRETGQDVPGDEGAAVRCILESLALKHAETVDLLAEVTGRDLRELHVVGGGANNDLLCTWTAQAAERPVSAGPTEATLIGNLLVQAIALGELSSIAEGRELVRRSFTATTYEPTVDTAWREARERFARLREVVQA